MKLLFLLNCFCLPSVSIQNIIIFLVAEIEIV